MGVVYHSHYLVWCEIGRTDHIRQSGMPYREMEERGIMLAVAEAEIRYQSPARYDDMIRVETVISRVASRTVTFDYVISNADTGAALATASTVLVSLNREHRVVALPRGIRELLARDATGST